MVYDQSGSMGTVVHTRGGNAFETVEERILREAAALKETREAEERKRMDILLEAFRS